MAPLKRLFAITALTLATCLALGCGGMPTAPASSDTASMAGAGRTSQPAGLLDGATSTVDGLVRLIVRTLNVVGSIGGSLSNGRWRVDIPPDAIEGTATVSLGVASSTSSACQLEISPASQNHFQVPVTLTVNCSSVPDDELRSYVIFRYDPGTKTWVPVEGSRVDLTTKTVSAPLQHFSNYAVGGGWGKSGW